MLPRQMLPQQMLPRQMSQQMLPRHMLPQQMLPRQMVPLEMMPPQSSLGPQPSQQLLSSMGPQRVTLNVKLPMFKDRIPVEMAVNDIVFKLKEKIVALEGMQGVTVDMIMLCPCLLNGGVWSPNMDVFLKWSGPVSRGSSSTSGKQMVGLTWMHVSAEQECLSKILIDVNPMDNVSWFLRKQIDPSLHLPRNWTFYFLYKQQVMNQQESFEWHGVRDGDTIRIFFGYVTDTIPFIRFDIFHGYSYF